jgi:multicomponent Na+:H+ antiporter subunit G
MFEVQSVVSVMLIVGGIFFIFIAGVGVIRLPDFYSRTHAVSKSDTLGILLVVLGLIIYEGLTINSLKLAFIFILVALANPIGSHALGMAALRKGLKPVLGRRDVGS